MPFYLAETQYFRVTVIFVNTVLFLNMHLEIYFIYCLTQRSFQVDAL